MSEDTDSTTPDLPKPGDEIAGMKMIDPIAEMDQGRTTELASMAQKPDARPGRKAKTRAEGPRGPSAESVLGVISGVLGEESLQVELIGADEHPRGPVIAVKRLPDTTRPVAYIDSGDNSWETATLTLNLYGFLDPQTVEEIQGPIRKVLRLSDNQVATFTRF